MKIAVSHAFFVSFCYFLFQGSVWYLCFFNDTSINSVSKCVLVILAMFLLLSTYLSLVDVAVREVRQFNTHYIVYSSWVESILVDDRTLLTEKEAVVGCVCNIFTL